MPQIPVFTPNQRIDASTPVAAINTTDSRMMGEAIAGIGGALERLGTVLDRTAKRAAAQEDEYMLKQAVNTAKIEMMARAQVQNQAAIDPEDDPSGIAGVQRFQAATNERLAEQTAALPERLRTQFQAEMSDHTFAYSAQVLANEVSKREKNVMILRQDNINKKADIVRRDYAQVPVVMAELEQDIMNDAMIPGIMKPKALLDAQQNAARAAVQGLAGKGQWAAAEKALRDDFSLIFDAEGLDKEIKDLKSQRITQDNLAWNLESRALTRQKQKEDAESDRVVSILVEQQRLNPGSDSFDSAAFAVLNNPTFPTKVKTKILEGMIVNSVKEAETEQALVDKFMRSPEQAISSAREQVSGSNMGVGRAQDLTNRFKDLNSAYQQDPTLQPAVKEADEIIKGFKAPPQYDPSTGTMREVKDVINPAARASFLVQLTDLVRQGKATPSAVKDLAYGTLRNQYSEQLRPTPVQGVGMDRLMTTSSIQEEITNLAKRYKQGEFKTPADMARLSKIQQALRDNQNRAKLREELAQTPTTSGNK